MGSSQQHQTPSAVCRPARVASNWSWLERPGRATLPCGRANEAGQKTGARAVWVQGKAADQWRARHRQQRRCPACLRALRDQGTAKLTCVQRAKVLSVWHPKPAAWTARMQRDCHVPTRAAYGQQRCLPRGPRAGHDVFSGPQAAEEAEEAWRLRSAGRMSKCNGGRTGEPPRCVGTGCRPPQPPSRRARGCACPWHRRARWPARVLACTASANRGAEQTGAQPTGRLAAGSGVAMEIPVNICKQQRTVNREEGSVWKSRKENVTLAKCRMQQGPEGSTPQCNRRSGAPLRTFDTTKSFAARAAPSR